MAGAWAAVCEVARVENGGTTFAPSVYHGAGQNRDETDDRNRMNDTDFEGGGDDVRPLWRQPLMLLLAAVVLPLFLQLGGRGLSEPDEGRYVEIAREMWATRDFLVPRLHGRPHYAKPPMTYWALAGAMTIAGTKVWAVRAVPFLAAAGVIASIFTLVRRTKGERAALAASLILASTFEFFVLARFVNADMLLTAFTTAALAFFWRHHLDGGRRFLWKAGFFIALGLAFLTKGPPALGVVILPLLSFGIWNRSLGSVGRLGWWWGVPLAVAINAPWFYLMFQVEERLFGHYMSREIVSRVANGLGRSQPFYFFLIVLIAGLFPWTPLFLRAFWKALVGMPKAGENADAELSRFLLSWIIAPFVMFSAVSSKLYPYILPLFPAAAVLTALLVVKEGGLVLSRRGGWAATATWLALVIVPLGALFWEKLMPTAVCVVAPTVAAAVVAFLQIGRREPPPLVPAGGLPAFAIVAFMGFGFFHGAHAAVATVEPSFHPPSYERLAALIDHHIVTGAKIPLRLRPSPDEKLEWGEGLRIVTYKLDFASGGFYLLEGKAEFIPKFGEGPGFEIKEDRALAPRRDLDELVALMNEEPPVVVLTKAENRKKIERAYGRRLDVIAAVGEGSRAVLAFSNVGPNSYLAKRLLEAEPPKKD